ncbi:MAG: hypothetical protein WCK59_00100 [Candidatus Falkowbacteria bacterium]
MNKLKPFHESIVKIIENAPMADLPGLCKVIKATKISSNHEAIITALENKMPYMHRHEYLEVVESVLKQKVGIKKCIIGLDCFKTLKSDQDIIDTENKIWKVITSDCRGQKRRFFTHLFRDPSGNLRYIFHNGRYMRFEEEKNTPICDAFIKICLR